jgi:hypothetical protein
LFKQLEHYSSDLHACVASASSRSSLPIEVVLDHNDFFGAIGISSKYSLDGSVSSLAFSSSDVPPSKENSIRSSK